MRKKLNESWLDFGIGLWGSHKILYTHIHIHTI